MRFKWILSIVLIAITGCPVPEKQGDKMGEIAVIVNKSHKMNQLDYISVRSIFLKKISGWEPFDRQSGVLKRKFLRDVCKMNENQWEDHWVQMRTVDGISSLAKIKTPYAVLEAIRKKKNGISYVDKAVLSQKEYKILVKEIKVVLIVK